MRRLENSQPFFFICDVGGRWFNIVYGLSVYDVIIPVVVNAGRVKNHCGVLDFVVTLIFIFIVVLFTNSIFVVAYTEVPSGLRTIAPHDIGLSIIIPVSSIGSLSTISASISVPTLDITISGSGDMLNVTSLPTRHTETSNVTELIAPIFNVAPKVSIDVCKFSEMFPSMVEISPWIVVILLSIVVISPSMIVTASSVCLKIAFRIWDDPELSTVPLGVYPADDKAA